MQTMTIGLEGFTSAPIEAIITKEDVAAEQSRIAAESSDGSHTEGLTAIKGNSRRRREAAQKKEAGTAENVAEDMEMRAADRRTVIWHAIGGVLDQAGVERRYFHKSGRLCRHRRPGETKECGDEVDDGDGRIPSYKVPSANLHKLLSASKVVTVAHGGGGGGGDGGDATPSKVRSSV